MSRNRINAVKLGTTNGLKFRLTSQGENENKCLDRKIISIRKERAKLAAESALEFLMNIQQKGIDKRIEFNNNIKKTTVC